MIAVLVACADDRRDIFETCFAHSEWIWKDCKWPRYVGLNTPGPPIYGFKVLCARSAAQTSAESSAVPTWTAQTAAYVDALPEEVDRILLMVEDVLFVRPVDGATLNFISRDRVKYLRLVPLRRNWWRRFVESFQFDINYLCKIPQDEPYYSSTEMVLWERGYLRQLLDYKNDAWSFEHIVTGVEHWAVWEPVLEQHQIVSRGKWARNAPALLAKVGLTIKGDRPHQGRRAYWRGVRENLSFALLGYLSFRIKRRFYGLPRVRN